MSEEKECKVIQTEDLKMWLEVDGHRIQINFHPFTGARAVVMLPKPKGDKAK